MILQNLIVISRMVENTQRYIEAETRNPRDQPLHAALTHRTLFFFFPLLLLHSFHQEQQPCWPQRGTLRVRSVHQRVHVYGAVPRDKVRHASPLARARVYVRPALPSLPYDFDIQSIHPYVEVLRPEQFPCTKYGDFDAQSKCIYIAYHTSFFYLSCMACALKNRGCRGRGVGKMRSISCHKSKVRWFDMYYSKGHLIIRNRKVGSGWISYFRGGAIFTNFNITTVEFLFLL